MDQDLFGDSNPQQENNYYSSNDPQIEEDQFDFGGQAESSQSVPNSFSNTGVAYNSQSNIEVDDQTTRKIREEEERIQEILRVKSNQEYEEKAERKRRAQKQLEDFMDKKEEQKAERKRANAQKQQKRKEQKKGQNPMTGWKKVSANVALKQGEHPGKKEVNRMRESILNKKNEE